MGGMGKTTLAKMATTTVIRDYARAWVTVGRGFDLKKIGNCILSQLSNKGEHQDSSDVELIMKRLHELLLHGGGGNKLLVVLDDLWPDDSSDLMGCPQGSAKESQGDYVRILFAAWIPSMLWTPGICWSENLALQLDWS